MRYLVLTLLLGACSVPAMRDASTCRDAVGTEPGTAWLILGASGGAVMSGSEAHHDWQARYMDCFHRRQADRLARQ